MLTICEQKSIEDTIKLALLLEHLEKNGFRSSRVCRTTQGELVGTLDDKAVLVKSFIDGKIVADLSDHLLSLIGMQLGQLHQIDAPDYLPRSIGYTREHFSEVELYAADSAFDSWLKDIDVFIEPYVSLDLPKSLVHSDVFFSNVIVSVNDVQVTIMDFEEASYMPRVFDIGMAIVGLCGTSDGIDLNKAISFLKGYLLEINLTDSERNSLQAFTVYAAAAMCFWRHKNFNYTNPDPKMYDHYMELKFLADFVRNLDQNEFWNE